MYQYNRMPLRLKNELAKLFKWELELILNKLKWKTCLVYLEDVIIFSKSIEENIKHMEEILHCLEKVGATLKIEKYNFFTSTVEYLRHIIKPGEP